MSKKNPGKTRSRRTSSVLAGRQRPAATKKLSNKEAARTTAARREAANKSLVDPVAAIEVSRIRPIVDIGRVWEEIGVAQPVEFRVSFARPDDLLVCDFTFYNLRLEGDKLVRKSGSAGATVVVELPPQSFGEQAFLDKTGPEVPGTPTKKQDQFQESAPDAADPADPNPPPDKLNPKNVATTSAEKLGDLPFAKIRMAGRSRLAFTMPGDEQELAFTLDAILDACRRWPMRLDACAAPEPQSVVLDKDWLKAVVVSDDWTKAGDTLLEALGGRSQAPRMERALAAAGKRVADQAAEALNSRRARGLNTLLARSMNQELDSLARDFPKMREGRQREYALAALSLLATQEFAAGNVATFDIGYIWVLPFIPVFLAPHKPPATVTALELPYRVVISPIAASNWWHAKQPVVRNGRTELWHTRLTDTADGVGVDPPTKVRAIWSPDYDLGHAEIINLVNSVKPFRMSLDPLDRQMLVKLMAGFDETDPAGHAFVPRAAQSRRLALSALGGLLDVEGSWSVLPQDVGLEQWRHLASLGRDHYVRVVYRGFLCPFGHSASLIKVTERKFEYLDTAAKKNRVAVLRQRFFIVVREPVKTYNGAGHKSAGRNFPYPSVEILTRVTPSLLAPDNAASKLSDPGDIIYGSVPNRACFWPMLAANRNFTFQVAATDIGGGRVTFAMPLLFVGVEANQNAAAIGEIIKRYGAKSEAPRRTAPFGNAVVCYAPPAPGSKGDPRLPTGEQTFTTATVSGIPITQPQFYPEVETALVGIAAIQRLLQKPDAVIAVTYPTSYLEGEFVTNPGEIFLKTLQPFELKFGEQTKSDTLGGLATPSMAILGLSLLTGPVAAKRPADPSKIEEALGQVIKNTFNPADFFEGAKILGGVELATILEIVPALSNDDVPKLLSSQLPDRIEARFDWKTNINKSDPLGLFVPNPDGAQTVLEMHGVVSSPIAQPAATTFNAEASIVNFKVNLFGFIIIWFDKLKFLARSGSKPDVTVDLHKSDRMIEFGGPLEFVNKLRHIIPSNGFSDPPALSVTPSGISASYSLNVPSVTVGMFALEHVSLGAGFALPFDSKPVEVRFNFCERQRPFSLTVSMLGGGGFFAIAVGAEGVREIEAAIEFGAALSIDLGVASGSVEVKAGVYFHWKQKSVELAGYVRLHGELSVLGIISASLTFNLQLAYLKETGHSVVWGEATLTVEIEVLFFSASVSVKCRREFGGSDADPKFVALIPDQATWRQYCEAFAAEA